MFYADIYERLQNMLVKRGSNYGLTRTRALLNALGSPDDGLKIIHVTASNGKGSICEYITRILVADGKKVGAYSSPSVFFYGDNFRIDGAFCGDEKLKKALSFAYSVALTLEDTPSAFEIETAAALYLFYSEGCEYAVIECGLGGLSDATNAINNKAVAVIGSVALEHTALLGSTLTQICEQKAGIIKNCPSVISCLQDSEALDYFSAYTASFSGEGLKILSSDLSGQSFLYDGENYKIRMLGSAQCYNAALAIDACRMLGAQKYAIYEGLQVAKLSGRIELKERGERTYILDGGHNPSALLPLAEVINDNGLQGQISLIFGCLSDKDVEGCAKVLSGCFKSVALVKPNSYRAMEIERIYRAFLKFYGEVNILESVEEALNSANTKYIAVCGSFTLLSEANKWIENAQ